MSSVVCGMICTNNVRLWLVVIFKLKIILEIPFKFNLKFSKELNNLH